MNSASSIPLNQPQGAKAQRHCGKCSPHWNVQPKSGNKQVRVPFLYRFIYIADEIICVFKLLFQKTSLQWICFYFWDVCVVISGNRLYTVHIGHYICYYLPKNKSKTDTNHILSKSNNNKPISSVNCIALHLLHLAIWECPCDDIFKIKMPWEQNEIGAKRWDIAWFFYRRTWSQQRLRGLYDSVGEGDVAASCLLSSFGWWKKIWNDSAVVTAFVNPGETGNVKVAEGRESYGTERDCCGGLN